MTRDKPTVARFGLVVKPHRGSASKTWYLTRDTRDSAYDRAKRQAGGDPDKFVFLYVKKVQR